MNAPNTDISINVLLIEHLYWKGQPVAQKEVKLMPFAMLI